MKIKTIKDIYFDDNNLVECLENKEEKRPYLYFLVTHKGNNFYIPFRTTLNERGNLNSIINVIAYDVSYGKRPYAKLDYSKMLIINDSSYIKDDAVIDSVQYTLVKNNIVDIERQAINYINGYVKAFNKGRTQRDNKYKFSTLVNYHKELGLTNKQ